MAAGRLNSDFPRIDPQRSLRDPATGAIVQPYGRFDRREPATLGRARRYRVELWPIGNRFRAGHRIRLTILGASGASKPERARHRQHPGGRQERRAAAPAGAQCARPRR